MTTLTESLSLEQLIDRQRKADEEAARISDEAFNAKRTEHLTEQWKARREEVNSHFSEELGKALNVELVNTDPETEQYPSRFELRFTLDDEPWEFNLNNNNLYPPDKNEVDEYGDTHYHHIPVRRSSWDDDFIREIRAWRDRVTQRVSKPVPEPKTKRPAEAIAGPYVVKHGLYASKLQDALNTLKAEGCTWQEIYLEQGGPDYNGTYTIVAKKRESAS